MKNREFYAEKIDSMLVSFGLCKVMSDLVFPSLREQYGTAVNCDHECQTCAAMFAVWLDKKAKYQEIPAETPEKCGCCCEPEEEGPRIALSFNGKPIREFANRNEFSEYVASVTARTEEEPKDADTVNFHKGTFETGEVGIYCDCFEDAVSLCHILSNMGYKGVDLSHPEEYKEGGFYVYGKHDGTVFMFDPCFIPYFESTTGKKIDEEFVLLNYREVNFLPDESGKTEDVPDELEEVGINLEEIIKALTTPFVSVALP